MVETLVKLGLTAVGGFLSCLMAGLVAWCFVDTFRGRVAALWSSSLPADSNKRWVIGAAFIAVAFAVGVALENVSRPILDNLAGVMPTEDEIRTEVYHESRYPFDYPRFLRAYERRAPSLLTSLFTNAPNGGYLTSLHRDLSLMEPPITGGGTWDKDKEQLALHVYYGVINTVQTNGLFAPELRVIQDRFRFARMLCLACVINALLALGLAAWSSLRHEPDDKPDKWRRWLFNGSRVALVLWLAEPLLWFRYPKWFQPLLPWLLPGLIVLGCLFLLCIPMWQIARRRRNWDAVWRDECMRQLFCLLVMITVVFCGFRETFKREVKAHARRVYGYGLELKEVDGNVSEFPGNRETPIRSIYAEAVRDSYLATRDEISKDLKSITNTNPVNVVTWVKPSTVQIIATTNTPNFEKTGPVSWAEVIPSFIEFRAASTSTNKFEIKNMERDPIWVTLIDEWTERVKDDWTNDTLRLEQLLGLPKDSGKTLFIVLKVDPKYLFRPSPDPEIDDRTAELRISAVRSNPFSTKKQWIWFLNWFAYHDESSYSGERKYPWTRLGYTYDWNTIGGKGLSEFCVLPDARLEIVDVADTLNFIEGILKRRSSSAGSDESLYRPSLLSRIP